MTRRHTGTSEKPWREVFVAALAEFGTVGAALRVAGISRTQAYRVRNDDEAFAAAWEAAIHDSTDDLIQEAITRAKDGSDVLLMFLIKQRDPTFRENSRLEITGAGGGSIRLAVAPDEERALTVARILEQSGNLQLEAPA